MRQLFFPIFLLSLIGCGKGSSQKDKTTPPDLADNTSYRIAVFGDSLAAGMMAGTQLGQTLPADDLKSLGHMITDFLTSPNHDSEFFKEIDTKYSESSVTAFAGQTEYALPQRLAKLLNRTVIAKNYAISSARTSTMQTQLEDFQRDVNRESKFPDVVILHVGGNDWCDEKSISEFRIDYTNRLNEIAAKNLAAKILIMPVPELVKVLTVSETVAFQSNASLAQPEFMCSKVKAALRTCSKRGIEMGALDDAVAKHRADLVAYNKVIDDVVADFIKTNKDFVGKIAIASEYAKGDGFEAKWLGIDCFHPGRYGQQQISLVAWPTLEAMHAPTQDSSL